MKLTHRAIARKIGELERAVLAFQGGIVNAAGAKAAADSNQAIILSYRLATVWRRLGAAIPRRSGEGLPERSFDPTARIRP